MGFNLDNFRMRLAASLLLAIICFAVASGRQVHAQPGPTPEYASFELQVASSDVVVLGSVGGIRLMRAEPDDYYLATMHVRETLLGDPRRRVSFVVADRTREEMLPWRERMDELLVVLVARGNSEREEHSVRDPSSFQLQPQHLPCFCWCVFSMNPEAEFQPVASADLTVLRTPAEILSATRRAIAAHAPEEGRLPEKHRMTFSHFLSIKPHRLRDAGLTGYFHYWLPVDARLQTNARDWITSENHGLREEGVKALAHFKSKENIELLKPLLADAFHWELPEYLPNGGYRTYEHYPVREAAWTTLNQWKVQVDKPVFKVPHPQQPTRED